MNQLTEHLFRENSGKMVSVLTNIFGLSRLDLVMDVVQDSFEMALRQWRFGNIPDNPPAWLMQVARNKILNTLKREHKFSVLDPIQWNGYGNHETEDRVDDILLAHEVEDSQLRLLLTCCYPDFSERNQVILTLNILCGFSTAEIANAMLMQYDAVKKSLFRMKSRLREKDNILKTPHLFQSEKRIRTLHTILYLMFNEGYKSTRTEQIINHDLCYESMRLTKLLLHQTVALQTESKALLALMFFNAARFPSRLSTNDEIVSLENQDRTKWDKALIQEGYHYLNEAVSGPNLSRFHLEAIIASVHCSSQSFEETDWEKIVYLYEQLEVLAPSSLTRLNRIMALSYLRGAECALQKLQKLEKVDNLQQHYLFHTAKGNLLKRSGGMQDAKQAFTKALTLVQSPLEKNFIEKQMTECH